MFEGLTYRRNSFLESLLGLEYAPTGPADIFSRACVESYVECDWTRLGYPFTQIFEPDVLREAAFLSGLPYESAANLAHRPTATMRRVAELVRDAGELPVAGRLNLASVLVSVSRFDLAVRILDDVRPLATTARERFEVAWLEFLISNRREDGAGSPAAFAKMLAAIDEGGIPRGRVLDACTQAVVWYLKRREVPENVFAWSVRVGTRLTGSPERLEAGAVSAWYRGIAMLPAARKDPAGTRGYMERAREAAEESVARGPRAYDQNLLKTWYESSIKEHMYVTGDFDRAEEAGRRLIALDPVWSPSHGELAELYQRFGRPQQAAECWERAVAAGPPYVGHHLLHAARARAALGDNDVALRHYRALADLAPDNQEVRSEERAVAGRRV